MQLVTLIYISFAGL